MTSIRTVRLVVVLAAVAVSTPALAQNKRKPADKEVPVTANGGEDGAADGEGGEGEDGSEGEDTSDRGSDDKSGAAGPVTDVDSLRKEYLKLRDELFRSRARAATVASALFSTKVTVYLNYNSGRFYTVTRATARLDGANVFEDTKGAVVDNKAPRFEGYVAPGRHKLAVRIEAVGKDDERFTAEIENTFTFQAPAGKDVTLIANVKDDGNIAYNWKKKQSGSYKLRVDLQVKSANRDSKKKLRGSLPNKKPSGIAAR